MYKISVIFASLLVAGNAGGGCSIFCTKIYQPVCGISGKSEMTFSNRCMMDLYNCEQRES